MEESALIYIHRGVEVESDGMLCEVTLRLKSDRVICKVIWEPK